MKRQKPIVFIIILVALVGSLVLRNNLSKPALPPAEKDSRTERTSKGASKQTEQGSGREAPDTLEFNRTLTKIVYTKHARCRMDCRRIDESEILEIRDEGKVNYQKSELNSRPDPKFAVEGVTHDKQFVRVVFAQTSNSLVVVTCIDLDTDWSCSCN